MNGLVAELSGEIEWKSESGFIKVLKEPGSKFVHGWHGKCKGKVIQFCNRFWIENHAVEAAIVDSVCRSLPVLERSLKSSGSACWLVNNNEKLLTVTLKANKLLVLQEVQRFLENVKKGNVDRARGLTMKISSDHIPFLERICFLETATNDHPGINTAEIDNTKGIIRFTGTSEAISAVEQKYKDLVRGIGVKVLNLSCEVYGLISQKAVNEYLEKSLSDRGTAAVLAKHSKSTLKIVAGSCQECKKVEKFILKAVCKATIPISFQNYGLLTTRRWYELTKSVEKEDLVELTINHDVEKRKEINLHGVTNLVEKYRKMIHGFFEEQKIETDNIILSAGMARFVKEKLAKETQKIIEELAEEQVNIEIVEASVKISGTKQGLNDCKRRIQRLQASVETGVKRNSSIGIEKLMFGESGLQKVKNMEAKYNAVIDVAKGRQTLANETRQTELSELRVIREKEKKTKAAPLDPFDECNFTTSEGIKVWWKYGNIALEKVSIFYFFPSLSFVPDRSFYFGLQCYRYLRGEHYRINGHPGANCFAFILVQYYYN